MSHGCKAYTLKNFREIPQVARLSKEQISEIQVVGHVFPFKANNYVVNEIIDWDNIQNDPMFALTFPQKGMLKQHDYYRMAKLVKSNADSSVIRDAADRIRMQLNPHPANQMEENVPTLKGRSLEGVQHKYRETVLFFPSQGQKCFAFCTFCFRWPQFVGIDDLKFSSSNVEELVAYLKEHPEVSDILMTGGDPFTMSGSTFAHYVNAILDADLPHIQTIRIGSKTLTYWPYRFITDDDSQLVLDTLKRIVDSGRHLAVMAQFNHPVELSTDAVQEAIKCIRETGAEIRTQSPILRHINAEADVWKDLWNEQVRLGLVPYYMFVVRDTGAQHFFGVPLVEAWDIFRKAYSSVSGIARTVRGPSMSTSYGKVLVSGAGTVYGRQVLVLNMIQGRNPDWVQRPFFAEYDEEALWLDDLVPAFGRRFFFEEEAADKRRVIGSGRI